TGLARSAEAEQRSAARRGVAGPAAAGPAKLRRADRRRRRAEARAKAGRSRAADHAEAQGSLAAPTGGHSHDPERTHTRRSGREQGTGDRLLGHAHARACGSSGRRFRRFSDAPRPRGAGLAQEAVTANRVVAIVPALDAARTVGSVVSGLLEKWPA